MNPILTKNHFDPVRIIDMLIIHVELEDSLLYKSSHEIVFDHNEMKIVIEERFSQWLRL